MQALGRACRSPARHSDIQLSRISASEPHQASLDRTNNIYLADSARTSSGFRATEARLRMAVPQKMPQIYLPPMSIRPPQLRMERKHCTASEKVAILRRHLFSWTMSRFPICVRNWVQPMGPTVGKKRVLRERSGRLPDTKTSSPPGRKESANQLSPGRADGEAHRLKRAIGNLYQRRTPLLHFRLS